jgi:hypothetical protein
LSPSCPEFEFYTSVSVLSDPQPICGHNRGVFILGVVSRSAEEGRSIWFRILHVPQERFQRLELGFGDAIFDFVRS